MILKELKLKDAFNREENAKRWLYSQITKCAMMASTVVPDAHMVDEFASVILQMYGQRPMMHLALFFGYAQVGLHFCDEDQIEHYGTFDLSSLLSDLDHHMRIVLNKSVAIDQKVKRIDFRIQMCDDIISGLIVHPDELAARDPSHPRHGSMTREQIAFFNSEEWEETKREQKANAERERERLVRQRNELLGI